MSKTDMVVSEKAFTIKFYPKKDRMMLIGRFDRVSGTGTVMCSRKREEGVEYDRRQWSNIYD